MYNFDPYNVFLAIATNIPQRLKTVFVLQGHICICEVIRKHQIASMLRKGEKSITVPVWKLRYRKHVLFVACNVLLCSSLDLLEATFSCL